MEPEAVVSIRSGFGVGTNSFYGADVNVDSNVQYLTPQAAALARMAAEAKCGKRDEGWDVRPHPILEPAAPSLQQFEEPGTAPVAVMRNPIAGKQVIAGSCDLSAPVPVNSEVAVPFESPLMTGHFILQIRGLKSSSKSVFVGKKRFLHIAIQGKLKRDVKASDIWTGHEWFQLPQLVPTSFVNVAYTAAAKMFSSTTRVCPSTANGQIAGFLNPMLASCQICNVSLPGQEPDIWNAKEDMRLLSPALADKNGNPLSSDKRRHWFDNPANAASIILNKDYTYTLHSWQHWCNIASYRLQVNSMLSFDLCQFSEGQPLQIMAKDQASGEYLINLLLWHKNLLYKDTSSSSSSSNDIHGVKDKFKSWKNSWQGMLTRHT